MGPGGLRVVVADSALGRVIPVVGGFCKWVPWVVLIAVAENELWWGMLRGGTWMMGMLAGGFLTACREKGAAPVAVAGPVECLQVAVERTGERVGMTLRLRCRNLQATPWKVDAGTFVLHAGSEVVPVLVRPFATTLELAAGETKEGSFRYWATVEQLRGPLRLEGPMGSLAVAVDAGILQQGLPEGKMVVVSGSSSPPL